MMNKKEPVSYDMGSFFTMFYIRRLGWEPTAIIND